MFADQIQARKKFLNNIPSFESLCLKEILKIAIKSGLGDKDRMIIKEELFLTLNSINKIGSGLNEKENLKSLLVGRCKHKWKLS